MNNTENFSFSIKAQNIQAQFYNRKAVVYVEGQDDLIFWSVYFPESDYKIIDVGGCENFSKKIDEVQNNGLKCIIACDSDYSDFENNPKRHPLIVRTLSHSIECIMYCPINLNECIKKLSRSFNNNEEEIEKCFEEFGDDTKELIAYDIANNIHKIGIEIAGDSCSRFLRKNSHRIDKAKISSYIDNIKTSFNGIDINKIIRLIEKDRRNMRQITKGHFQTSFVINLIKHFVYKISSNKVNMPCDILYALLVNCPPSCSKNCLEKSTIKERIETAMQHLRSS